MSSQTQGITLPDTSLSGVLIWITIMISVVFLSILMFEYFRKNPRFRKVYYTRISMVSSPVITNPDSLFGWIRSVFYIPESVVIEQVGLDAAMYLRYLYMCFYLFGFLMLGLFFILIPVNYAAARSNEIMTNITISSGTILTLASYSLSSLSLAYIPDGSSIFWVHCICAYLVSFTTYFVLYSEYKNYVCLVSNALREPKEPLEKLQQCTILITNLPKHLGTKLALEKWLVQLDVGKVKSIFMNNSRLGELRKKTNEYKNILHKLENAYMRWAISIYKSIHHRKWLSLGHVGATTRLAIIETLMSEKEKQETKDLVAKLRPLFLFLNETGSLKRLDVINTLSRKLIILEGQISQLRLYKKEQASATVETLEEATNVYDDLNSSSTSAFITFKSRRSAYMLLQMKLDSSMNGYSMNVYPAPLPNDILWKNLSKSILNRTIKRSLISIISISLCIGWVIPTYYISNLTMIGMPDWINQSPYLALFLKTVLPPILILVCTSAVPYLLDFFSTLQRFDSLNDVQEATFSKYFVFLMFNVHFVFTLLSVAVNTSHIIFVNPLQWVEALSVSFPAGGSFFINYIILNLIMFPVELLRPGAVIYFLSLRWLSKTPRDFMKLSEATSILNYGYIYPFHVFIFIVVLCYSIIMPLVILPGFLYFGMAWLVYKNQLLYCYVKQSEGRGKLWKMAYHRSVFGLAVFQFLTAGLLSAKLAPLPAIFTGILIIITYLFYRYCSICFDKHDMVVPLEHLISTKSPIKSPFDLNSPQKFPLTDSPLKVSTISNEEEASSPQLGSPEKYTNQDYQTPYVSKPLPELWAPAYISHLVEQITENINEDCIHSDHSVELMESGRWTSLQELTSKFPPDRV